MKKHTRLFLDLSIKVNALKFGDFILKSGRKSPYFFNAGAFNTGPALAQLGSFYAETLLSNRLDCDHLFGPAYKGIPLATAVALALSQKNIHTTLTFNRKEIKRHGEGGVLFGAPLTGNTIIVDDVVSAGTAFREAKKQIQDSGATLSGFIIALDRCEKGEHVNAAIEEIKSQGTPVASIANLYDVLDYLQSEQKTKEIKAIEKYLTVYGI